MNDLFVELCLTVPVRLRSVLRTQDKICMMLSWCYSSLLPYLHMLMDPLVSALNGSQTLISQGLRTLELCVDNLQPDFLYEHIQPVRAELMQVVFKKYGLNTVSILKLATIAQIVSLQKTQPLIYQNISKLLYISTSVIQTPCASSQKCSDE